MAQKQIFHWIVSEVLSHATAFFKKRILKWIGTGVTVSATIDLASADKCLHCSRNKRLFLENKQTEEQKSKVKFLSNFAGYLQLWDWSLLSTEAEVCQSNLTDTKLKVIIFSIYNSVLQIKPVWSHKLSLLFSSLTTNSFSGPGWAGEWAGGGRRGCSAALLRGAGMGAGTSMHQLLPPEEWVRVWRQTASWLASPWGPEQVGHLPLPYSCGAPAAVLARNWAEPPES